MKLCLCLHCLCESYDSLPTSGQELFISIPDLRELIKQLQDRGYQFTPIDDGGDQTVTITFDDGYYNNRLFVELATEYSIPFILFVSAFYLSSGTGFPWLDITGQSYDQMHEFDYYAYFGANAGTAGIPEPDASVRPMTFSELQTLANSCQMEVGCHGYYHQPLSSRFENRLAQERDTSMAILRGSLNVSPRYFSLANGQYSKNVMRQLLNSYDKVFTIDGRPVRSNGRVVHRMSLVNPALGGPLIGQIDSALAPARRIKRALKTTRNLYL
jgi:peptidoglycan/xylan/chitin deacetylase (PgdA/CDA1 family)